MPPPVSPPALRVVPLLRDAILLSVRLVARAHGAPKRCRRSTGRCHLNLDAERTGHCPGGISEAALDQAALMLVFLADLGRAPPPRE